MYKLLLVLASAAALKRPQPQRALAVRGGEIDPLQVGKGIVLASGIYGVFDPAGNLDKYGMKGNDKDNAMMRLTAWSQILYAAALNLDTESVHGQTAASSTWRASYNIIQRRPSTSASSTRNYSIKRAQQTRRGSTQKQGDASTSPATARRGNCRRRPRPV